MKDKLYRSLIFELFNSLLNLKIQIALLQDTTLSYWHWKDRIPLRPPDLPLIILHQQGRKLLMDPHLRSHGVSRPGKEEMLKSED